MDPVWSSSSNGELRELHESFRLPAFTHSHSHTYGHFILVPINTLFSTLMYIGYIIKVTQKKCIFSHGPNSISLGQDSFLNQRGLTGGFQPLPTQAPMYNGFSVSNSSPCNQRHHLPVISTSYPHMGVSIVMGVSPNGLFLLGKIPI